MDLVRRRQYYFLHDSQAFSPPPPPPPITAGHHSSSSSPSSHSGFPIIAVAIIGIFATGFLLVSYYVFVIKCCLNWHRIDLLRRFSFSRRRRMENHALTVNFYSPSPSTLAVDQINRGLDEAVIRSIPIFQYRKSYDSKENDDYISSECAVCLNEFQEEEKLRIIPNCGHLFHIDCIDVWLQNNANCPLCRNSSLDQQILPFSLSTMVSSPPAPLPPQAHEPNEEYVVIEIGNEQSQTNNDYQERIPVMNSGELLSVISPSSRKLEEARYKEVSQKKKKKFHHVSSMGDECIDTRKKDDNFVIQPMRRSISMDSAADPHLYLAVQEIMQQIQQQQQNVNPSEGCSCSSSNSRIRRSFFSFGHGKGSRNAVLPVHLEP